MDQRAYLQCVFNRKVYLYDLSDAGYPAINAALYFLLCIVLLSLAGVSAFFIDGLSSWTAGALLLCALNVGIFLGRDTLQVLVGEAIDEQRDASLISAETALETVQTSKRRLYPHLKPVVYGHAVVQLALALSLVHDTLAGVGLVWVLPLTAIQVFTAYGVYVEFSALSRIAKGRNTVCWREDRTPLRNGFKRAGGEV